ncbi:monocarboxylate permease-like protein-like protein [Xylariomycetidae sp. FL0641]|nr:monocarboxylate permease-like protein-like protein [Xylariomycetidae sp. FL0641]
MEKPQVLVPAVEQPSEATATDVERDAPETTPDDAATVPPPDQGAAAWRTVAGSFCLMFVSFGWISCIGVFQEYYQRHQLRAYSPSAVAWIASVETCVMFIWGPVVGKIFDTRGPRALLLAGTALHVGGLLLLSLATRYWQLLLAQGVCSATGASLLFFGGAAAVATWFARRRALALGLALAGSGLGGVVFPLAVHHLVRAVGFAWTLRACALLVLLCCAAAAAAVTSRLPPAPAPLALRDHARPLREPPFAAFTAGYFLFYLGFYVPYNFVILEAERYGMRAELAAYLIPIFNVGGSIGRIAPGWLADRVGRFNIMVLVAFFSALTVLGLWIPGRSPGAVLAFSVLYGFGSGAFVALAPAVVAQISPLAELGARQGTCFAFVAVASLVGNPIAGALVPDTSVDPFWRLQLFAGMMMMGGAAMIAVARVAAGGVALRKVV